MKNYISTKIVKAEPETRGKKEGYAIEYPDGYKSWCPKGEFERTYREISVKETDLIERKD